jgi:hypothetical protein
MILDHLFSKQALSVCQRILAEQFHTRQTFWKWLDRQGSFSLLFLTVAKETILILPSQL